MKQKPMIIEGQPLTGAEELRLCVSNINATSETFNDRYTAVELLQINRTLVAGEWDILPDQWSTRQVREALKGIPPQFDEGERPVYAKRKAKK